MKNFELSQLFKMDEWESNCVTAIFDWKNECVKERWLFSKRNWYQIFSIINKHRFFLRLAILKLSIHTNIPGKFNIFETIFLSRDYRWKCFPKQSVRQHIDKIQVHCKLYSRPHAWICRVFIFKIAVNTGSSFEHI